MLQLLTEINQHTNTVWFLDDSLKPWHSQEAQLANSSVLVAMETECSHFSQGQSSATLNAKFSFHSIKGECCKITLVVYTPADMSRVCFPAFYLLIRFIVVGYHDHLLMRADITPEENTVILYIYVRSADLQKIAYLWHECLTLLTHVDAITSDLPAYSQHPGRCASLLG